MDISRREQVTTLYSQGLRDAAIANQIGLTRQRVHMIRTALGLPPHPAPPPKPRFCRYCHKRVEVSNVTICPDCKLVHHRARYITAFCVQCGAIVVRKWNDIKRYNLIFCNHSCGGKWLAEHHGFSIHPEHCRQHNWKPKYFCPQCGGGAKIKHSSKSSKGYWYKSLSCTVCPHTFRLHGRDQPGAPRGMKRRPKLHGRVQPAP